MEIQSRFDATLHMPTSPEMQKGASASQQQEEQEVAASFEAMFLQQMLKGMRESSFGGKKEFGRQTFEEMFDEQIARAVAGQGIGLGEALFTSSPPVATQESPSTVDRAESGAVATPRPGQRGL